MKYGYITVYGMQRPKFVNDGNLRTMGNPKGLKPYGCGGLVKSLDFMHFSSNFNNIDSQYLGLDQLIKINNFFIKHVDELISFVANLEVFIWLYIIIKSRQSNDIFSVMFQMPNINNINWFYLIKKRLLDIIYWFCPIRPIYYFKLLSDKKSQVIVNILNDKVIKYFIYNVLNVVYKFFYGIYFSKINFFPLKTITENIKWYTKITVRNHFIIISSIFLNFFNKRIFCQKLLFLIKFLSHLSFVKNSFFKKSNIELLLNIIIIPLLINIYIYKFYNFTFFFKKLFTIGKYFKKLFFFRKIKRFLNKKTYTNIVKNMYPKSWEVKNPDFFYLNIKRFYCAHKVNNFVIKILGSISQSICIKEKVRVFFYFNLYFSLNSENSTIRRFCTNFNFFLYSKIKKVFRAFKLTRSPSFKISIKDLFKKAVIQGFFVKRLRNYVPTKVGWLINLDHAAIIDFYNFFIKKILNYCKQVYNRKLLGYFVNGLRLSCARTLALKYKLRFASKAYKKFSSKLKCPNSGLALFLPKRFKY